MHIVTISVPNLSISYSYGIEKLFKAIRDVELADEYRLDFRNQAMVAPQGVLAILLAARLLHRRNGHKIGLVGMDDLVHSYFHRVHLFEVGQEWLYSAQPLKKKWNQISQSTNLLDITPVHSADQIVSIVKHAEKIFAQWLAEDDLPRLSIIVSELCMNILLHSRDPLGCLMIQKYEMIQLGHVKICLAFADLGVGIRGSLNSCHLNLPFGTDDCLRAAMDGLSSRGVGKVGMGISNASRIAKQSGGSLILRSDDASLVQRNKGIFKKSGLVAIPGTQLTVEFRAPLKKAA